MTTAQIAEQIIRRHQGEVLTLCLAEGNLVTDRFTVSPAGNVYRENGRMFGMLEDVREVFPGPLTRQQIQEFYREHGVPKGVRYA